MPTLLLRDNFFLRPAEDNSADIKIILDLIYELAVYEKCPENCQATPELIKRSIFEKQYAHAVLAIDGTPDAPGEPIGLAIYFFNFSTWTGKCGVYLEDLFVREKYRSRGAGRALFAWLGGVAKENEAARAQWQVLDWNEPSIKFYKSIGAIETAEWKNMRMTGEALQNLEKLG